MEFFKKLMCEVCLFGTLEYILPGGVFCSSAIVSEANVH